MTFLSEISQKLLDLKSALVHTVGALLASFLIAYVVIKMGDSLIERIFKPRDQKQLLDERRILTLKTLSKSILRYIIYFVLGFTIIGHLADLTGTDPKNFIAGAGILGVALGFGAQSLVRDVITGFFILLEDQYSVGEYITTGNFSGFVQEVELRITKLRDWGGEYHIIPNGQITAVTNFSRGSMRALVEVGIAYEEDIDKAIDVMNIVAQDVGREFTDLIDEGPEVLGVVAFGPSEVIIRTVAKTKPMEQWRIERELRKRYKEAFDREGIEMPYPRRVVITQDSNAERKSGVFQQGRGETLGSK